MARRFDILFANSNVFRYDKYQHQDVGNEFLKIKFYSCRENLNRRTILFHGSMGHLTQTKTYKVYLN